MSQILDIFICMCSQQVHLLVMLRHDRFIINSSLFNKTLIYIRDILHAFIYIYIYRTSNNFAKYIFIVCNKKMKDMIGKNLTFDMALDSLWIYDVYKTSVLLIIIFPTMSCTGTHHLLDLSFIFQYAESMWWFKQDLRV